MDVFGDFTRALAQIGDKRFRRVIGLGLLLAVALLGLSYAALLGVVDLLAPASVEIPGIGPVSGIDTLISWGSAVLMLVLSIFLMIPVAVAFAGLFLEDVAQAVEDRHYPGLPPVQRVGLGQTLIETINFLGLVIAVNTAGLVLYLFAGPAIPLIFWGLNGADSICKCNG
jgi:CysZ protein